MCNSIKSTSTVHIYVECLGIQELDISQKFIQEKVVLSYYHVVKHFYGNYWKQIYLNWLT